MTSVLPESVVIEFAIKYYIKEYNEQDFSHLLLKYDLALLHTTI